MRFSISCLKRAGTFTRLSTTKDSGAFMINDNSMLFYLLGVELSLGKWGIATTEHGTLDQKVLPGNIASEPFRNPSSPSNLRHFLNRLKYLGLIPTPARLHAISLLTDRFLEFDYLLPHFKRH